MEVPLGYPYRNCIVFPQKGNQPLPDQMAGGDLDGDEYLVSRNMQDFFPRQPADPLPRIAPPSKKHSKVIEIDQDPRTAMIDHLSERLGNFEVGSASKTWESAAERAQLGVKDPYCLAMWNRYEACLDVNKSGDEIPPLPDVSLKGPCLPKDQLGPIKSLQNMVPESLEESEMDFTPDPDLIYKRGSKEWDSDVELFTSINREYVQLRHAEMLKNGERPNFFSLFPWLSH